ncbi:NUMOD4 motif-containing HNH endonuclease [Mycobacterium kansasii]
MTVEWRPVVGFDGSYEVSDQGQVRSLDRTKVTAGKVTRISGRLLKPMVQHKGYLTVGLYRGGKRTIRPVHRLVLEAFIGPGIGYQACHVNGDRADNRAQNLYWGTNSENQLDSVRHGTHRSVRATECPNGHPYDDENTYIAPRTGQRVCRECVRTKSREYQRRKRMEWLAS